MGAGKQRNRKAGGVLRVHSFTFWKALSTWCPWGSCKGWDRRQGWDAVSSVLPQGGRVNPFPRSAAMNFSQNDWAGQAVWELQKPGAISPGARPCTSCDPAAEQRLALLQPLLRISFSWPSHAPPSPHTSCLYIARVSAGGRCHKGAAKPSQPTGSRALRVSWKPRATQLLPEDFWRPLPSGRHGDQFIKCKARSFSGAKGLWKGASVVLATQRCQAKSFKKLYGKNSSWCLA